MKQPKRPAESKRGRVLQTGSSPTVSTGKDLSYSHRALGGVGSTNKQNCGKSRHADRRGAMKEFGKDFHKMQLGFTNADLGYAGRLDDKQGSNTIVMMERVREAITFNAVLADESTWLWLTSEQVGFALRPTGGGEHEERREVKRGSRFMLCYNKTNLGVVASDSSEGVRRKGRMSSTTDKYWNVKYD